MNGPAGEDESVECLVSVFGLCLDPDIFAIYEWELFTGKDTFPLFRAHSMDHAMFNHVLYHIIYFFQSIIPKNIYDFHDGP